jgi:hypothetical protein
MSLANEWADGEDLYKTLDIVIVHQMKAMTWKIGPTQEHAEFVREADNTATLTLIQPTW